jgi:oleandomycin transport system ATP-binding protein
MATVIEAEGLEKRFGSTQALAGAGFAAERGTVLALLGPNGAGKTTAVRMLVDAAQRAVKTYSGGMRRRLDLAASLVGDPEVIFLDEPTTGLDPRARNQVWGTIRGLVARGVTVLLTTQYLEEADVLADRIAVIDRGRVVAAGTASDLKATTGQQTIEVRPLDRYRAGEVADVVTRLTGARPDVHPETGLVTATAADPAVLPELVRRLDETGILAAELALRLPSLDEVFLTLTGHHAEDESADLRRTA